MHRTVRTHLVPDSVRSAGPGLSYVYVLPCRDRDLAKIGFSRNPLRRAQTLHRRWFEFFDLERGLLIETDRASEARRIEREFIDAFASQRTRAPSEVSLSAAGHTEWFAGIETAASARARAQYERAGWRLHVPLKNWYRAAFETRIDRLHDWSSSLLEAIEYERFNVPDPERSAMAERALRDALDAVVSLDYVLDTLVPQAVIDWYHCSTGQPRRACG